MGDERVFINGKAFIREADHLAQLAEKDEVLKVAVDALEQVGKVEFTYSGVKKHAEITLDKIAALSPKE